METILSIDFTILNWIQEHLRCALLDGLCDVLGLLGHAGTVWIIASVVLLFFKRTRAAGVMALLAMGVGYLLGDWVIKPLVQRPRPFMTEDPRNLFWDAELIIHRPSGYSFPSGHCCAATAFVTVMFAEHKVIGWIALPAVLLMLFSRAYGYVHFPSDVLAGVLLGALSATAILILFRATKLDKRLSGVKRPV